MLLVRASEQASGLGFPEGPLILGDGRLAFVEEYTGCVSVLEEGAVRRLAHVGGNPNGLAMAADGLLYVTRGRGTVGGWDAPEQVTPAIVAVDPNSDKWEVVTTTAAGRPLRAPNDLCVGPDGMLYFTDPDDFKPGAALRGWICRHGPKGTEILWELENTFPNGLAFDADGRLAWVESHTKHVIRSTVDSWEKIAQLGQETTPDGCAYTSDGRLVVATLFTGGLDVVDWRSGSAQIDRLTWGQGIVTTNCCFDGNRLWVTDVTERWQEPEGTGKLWLLETELNGLPL